MQEDQSKANELRELVRVLAQNPKGETPLEQIQHGYALFKEILELMTAAENIRFSSIFSRLSFVCGKYKIKGKVAYLAHQVRRKCELTIIPEEERIPLLRLMTTLLHFLLDTYILGKSQLVWDDEVTSIFEKPKAQYQGFRRITEAILTNIDWDHQVFSFIDEMEADVEKFARFDVSGVNDQFTHDLKQWSKYMEFPFSINLIDSQLDEDGYYVPSALVLLPDYFLDVTTISEISVNSNHKSMIGLLKKFDTKPASVSLLIGNIANLILDELVNQPGQKLADLSQKIFQYDPIQWAKLSDEEVAEVFGQIKIHFENLNRVLTEELPKLHIKRENINLEPSFFCRDYGIQGRLDVLHLDQKAKTAAIIELKSGKPFKTNSYGLNDSHYRQTLLYDMLIQVVFAGRYKPLNYILYSQAVSDSIRFAPSLKSEQYELMKCRNELVLLEYLLQKGGDVVARSLSFLKINNFPKVNGFLANDIRTFEGQYAQLTDIEKAYIQRFTSFIAKEQFKSKVGEQGIGHDHGQAALWLENLMEKKERFAIFNHLVILENHSMEEDAILVLQKTELTNPLASFRVGDIATFYPVGIDQKVILQHQVFKCSIIDLTDDKIKIRLRNRQFNQALFLAYDYWTLDEDSTDSGFRVMYRNLGQWMSAEPTKRKLLLGLEAPKPSYQDLGIRIDDPSLTHEQKALLHKMVTVEDYFLLWGPPGTGKTSQMVKHLVQLLHKYTTENILLVAYTNRAVDELCDALTEGGFGESFLRIGSRFATNARHSHSLLDQKVSTCRTREEIRQLFERHRIIIGTLSSLSGRLDLLQFKRIDTIIVDEASQIIEPMIVGLLTMFKRFILIGDHKQLPAVVRQDPEESDVDHEELRALGLTNGRNSLFERLLQRCKDQGWQSAWGILTYQGRMHVDLLNIPNRLFYEGQLKPIPQLSRLQRKDNFTKHPSQRYPHFNHSRILFIPSQIETTLNWKTNEHEADLVAKLVHQIIDIYQERQLEFGPESLGIITPYRAQIALIRSKLGPMGHTITVDTVERYQGGARDIIILSLCANRSSQLDQMAAMDQSGIDRKLNVALTRAKEQLVLIGNRDLMMAHERYALLIAEAELVDNV